MGGLGTSKLFGELLTSELQSLEQTAQLLSFDAGQEILHEGEPGTGIYVIAEGSVEISSDVGHDTQKVLSTLGPGDFFGEMAVMDEQGRSATATAKDEVKAHFIARDDLFRILSTSPDLMIRLMREISLRMREFNHHYTKEVLQAERLALVGRFARSIVHDFKNPLNVVGISADMAAAEDASPELRLTCRDRIRRQVNRLSNMVSELLEFTRGRSQQVVMARLDYADFVRGFMEEIVPELETRQIRVVMESEPPPVGLLLDPTRLTHVFQNILNNAADMIPDGGQITLRFREEEGAIVTEIQDSGPGVAPEMADRLFEAFATHGKARGTGLGLSICRRIIEDHQGEIWSRNAPEGGAIFAFSIPLPKAPNPSG